MSIQFKVIRDWESEKFWRSTKFNNSEFDYWLIAKLTYNEQWMKNPEYKYHMELWVSAPDKVSNEQRDSYLSSLGLNENEMEVAEIGKAEALTEYLVEAGCGVVVWQKSGNNKESLLRELRSEAEIVNLLFGFYMDRSVNMIRTTGWEALTGDLLVGLRARGEIRSD